MQCGDSYNLDSLCQYAMTSPTMSVIDSIREKLTAGLSPIHLDVIDESHLHAGHAGAREGGESHFRVTIIADIFDGENRVQRHRRVNTLLKAELAGPVHALSLKLLTPQEAAAEDAASQ